MTFKEFFDANIEHGLFAVTHCCTAKPEVCEVLLWRGLHGSYKWFRPKPFWGVEECGYVGTIDANSKIVNVREIA